VITLQFYRTTYAVGWVPHTLPTRYSGLLLQRTFVVRFTLLIYVLVTHYRCSSTTLRCDRYYTLPTGYAHSLTPFDLRAAHTTPPHDWFAVVLHVHCYRGTGCGSTFTATTAPDVSLDDAHTHAGSCPVYGFHLHHTTVRYVRLFFY